MKIPDGKKGNRNRKHVLDREEELNNQEYHVLYIFYKRKLLAFYLD